jgi:H+/Cl- antiporter ClcA
MSARRFALSRVPVPTAVMCVCACVCVCVPVPSITTNPTNSTNRADTLKVNVTTLFTLCVTSGFLTLLTLGSEFDARLF